MAAAVTDIADTAPRGRISRAAAEAEVETLAQAGRNGVVRPRAIIDRRALAVRLEALLAEAPAGDTSKGAHVRGQVLAILKQALEAGRAEIRRRFDETASGAEVVRANCYLTDQIIRVIYDYVTTRVYRLGNRSKGERLALAALGGYGRSELAPQSDVDLLFVLPYKMTPHHEQVVEAMLYLLWDLGFKVGHAVRSVAVCLRLAKSDMTIRTSLLEMRFLWGDQPLYAELKKRFQKEIVARGPTKFIEAKLAERDERHGRLGASRYVLEPNIKDGKGGLRDLHTLFWITRYVYHVASMSELVERGVFTKAEMKRFIKARNFLWTLRCHLHYLTGRPEERLTFDVQKELAPRMGYTAHAGTLDVERLMKHYFLVAKDVGDLTRIFCAAIEAEHNRRSRFRLNPLRRNRRIGGFRVEGDRLSVAKPEVFAEKPIEMLRIFKVAQENDLDIHPAALRAITQNLRRVKQLRPDPEANRIFLDILTSPNDPETALRRMNEAGVFGRFVPDFGRVVAQMQYNMYHHFTVDEHTIFAIGILHRIEKGGLSEEAPIASEVVHEVLSRRVLYLAVLLHDIAKGRGGDHSELGAEIAYKLCPRLGLTDEETETVAWLVLHHLAMSDMAFKRDIDDPQTIQGFADLMQSMERLRLLLVLTVADIRAVGPGTWNAWKAALLRELYWRTEEVLTGGLAAEGREERVVLAKDSLVTALDDWPAADVRAHLVRGTPAYWLSLDTDTHVHHAQLVRRAEAAGTPLTVDTRIDRYREVTEVTIYTADTPGLFSRIAGAIAVAGGSIDAAKIFTLANGMALDTFFVRDAQGGPFDRPSKLARLSSAVERTLSGQLDPMAELARRKSTIASRYQVFKVAPRVLIDNRASARYTVVEVNGRDRPGLLYQVTLALTGLKLMIHSAKISTYGERAVDVFYVADARGGKVEGAARQNRVRGVLLEALQAADGKAKSGGARSGGAKVKSADATRRKKQSAAAD